MRLKLNEMFQSLPITSTMEPNRKVNSNRIAKLQSGKLVYLYPDSLFYSDPDNRAVVVVKSGGNVDKAYVGRWRFHHYSSCGHLMIPFCKYTNYLEIKPLWIYKSPQTLGDEYLCYTYLNTVRIL